MGLFSKKEKISIVQPSENDLIETLKLGRSIDLPSPKQQRGYDWVLFGHNNQFPMDLLEYKNSSSIHSSIIESKTDLIAGMGFMFGDTRELSNEYIFENWKLIPFWRKLDKIFRQVVRDQQIFGYSCFEIIYSVDRTRIVDINWLDASRVACGVKDENGDIKDYYYSEDWKNTRNYEPRRIEGYDPNGESINQLMFIQYDSNSMDYYSLPNYYSALRWIKADSLMAEYNLSAIDNGFSPSIVFKFYKKPSPEERRVISESIERKHGGVKNAGKAIILYSDGKELSPDISTLDATNIDNRLITVADQIIQNIITAHRAHPQLLGIPTGAKLGISNELLQSWSIFDSMVVQPERKLILDAFKEVLIFNGISRFSIEPLVPIKIME